MIKVKYNHVIIALELFTINQKFFQANIIIIKDNIKAIISFIKTLDQIHNFNYKKYFTFL